MLGSYVPVQFRPEIYRQIAGKMFDIHFVYAALLPKIFG